MSSSRPLREELIHVLAWFCGPSNAPDALDAFLDALETRADEWSGQAVRRHPFGKGPVSTPKTVIEHAIAVLREDT